MGKFVKAVLVLSLLASAVAGSFAQTAAAAEEKQYVMLYSSLKDSQLAAEPARGATVVGDRHDGCDVGTHRAQRAQT